MALSETVRHLVGLENLLTKARRRHRESEREEGSGSDKARRYRALIKRLSDEIHGADQAQLQEYLAYVESQLIPRIARKVDKTKEQMVAAARKVVDGRVYLLELRHEYTDALERSRVVRERLNLDPFRPAEAHFGIGPLGPEADRHDREARDIVKDYLKQ
jgi:hypothetical protein